MRQIKSMTSMGSWRNASSTRMGCCENAPNIQVHYSLTRVRLLVNRPINYSLKASPCAYCLWIITKTVLVSMKPLMTSTTLLYRWIFHRTCAETSLQDFLEILKLPLQKFWRSVSLSLLVVSWLWTVWTLS